MKIIKKYFLLVCFYLQFIIYNLQFTSCDPIFKNDYKDNSPTSGKLKVYYDEGLQLHVKNQAYTFESQYSRAKLFLIESNSNEAVKALYNDSCEAIIIPRELNTNEKKAFASKNYHPNFSVLAYTGIVFITNIETPINSISKKEIEEIFVNKGKIKDSVQNETSIRALIDKSNSSTLHYLIDTVFKNKNISTNCNALQSTLKTLDFVTENKNTVAALNFAWLSDGDDSITKHYLQKIKILGIKIDENKISYPSQSSFKLKDYPFVQTIYYYRKTGDFTLAKGFESFSAGPKGQLTFLKQGLLPNKQQERMIEVKFEPLKSN